jgi:hypothetical protein
MLPASHHNSDQLEGNFTTLPDLPRCDDHVSELSPDGGKSRSSKLFSSRSGSFNLRRENHVSQLDVADSQTQIRPPLEAGERDSQGTLSLSRTFGVTRDEFTRTDGRGQISPAARACRSQLRRY